MRERKQKELMEQVEQHQGELRENHKVKASLHNEMGKARMAIGETEEALKSFHAARQEDPDLVEALENQGEALLRLGRFEEAEKAFQGTLDADPKRVHIYNRLGITLRQQGRFQQALEAYQKAQKYEPENERIFFNLAVLWRDKGAPAKAREYLLRALALKPEFQEAARVMESSRGGSRGCVGHSLSPNLVPGAFGPEKEEGSNRFAIAAQLRLPPVPIEKCPQRKSNPRRRLERAVS